MSRLSGEARARSMRDMFARIARRYDAMNRLMTAGQDVRWRRAAIRRAGLRPGDRVLDLGAGTGDLAREALRQQSACCIVAADFTIEMMQAGKRPERSRVAAQSMDANPLWCAADALRLPFADESFDTVVSGFLLRNVIDLPLALREQRRVLKPGGRWVSLDTTRPRRNALYPLVQFHLHRVIPALGRLIAGSREAYTYLPDSTEHFLAAEDLTARLRDAGFGAIGFARRMFGTVAIHWARK